MKVPCLNCTTSCFNVKVMLNVTDIFWIFIFFPLSFLGKWSAGFGVTKESACVYCGTGKYGLTKGAKDDRVCIDCSVGKYLDSVGASRSRNCQNCPIGFVQPEEGAAYCLECIPGKFSASEGLTSCLDCSTGQFKSSGQTQCQDCPSGYDSGTHASVCNKCPAGKAGRGCKRCTVGQYRSADDQVRFYYHFIISLLWSCMYWWFGVWGQLILLRKPSDKNQIHRYILNCVQKWFHGYLIIGYLPCPRIPTLKLFSHIMFFSFSCTLTCYCHIKIKGIGLQTLLNWFRQ